MIVQTVTTVKVWGDHQALAYKRRAAAFVNQSVTMRRAMCALSTGDFCSTYYVMPCSMDNTAYWTMRIVHCDNDSSNNIIIVEKVIACLEFFFRKYNKYPKISASSSSSSVQVFSGYGSNMYKIMAKRRLEQASRFTEINLARDDQVEDFAELMALLTT